MKNIKIIGFDADDTLWINEPYFYDTTRRFCALLAGYADCHQVEQTLYQTEVSNIQIYGYGAKSFILSMVETALHLSNHRVDGQVVGEILQLGKSLINKPVELIDGIKHVLEELNRQNYMLVVATKGDLLDQQRKLKKSGLADYFHHVEIMSEKKESDYSRMLERLEIDPESFVMVGNSLKSDIIPVLNLGAHGIHVPFHTTWQHEEVDDSVIPSSRYKEVDQVSQILKFLSG